MTPQEQADEDELALAEAEAKAQSAASSKTSPTEADARAVETPQGPQQMVGNRPVLSADQMRQQFAASQAKTKEDALKAVLSGLQGPANFLTDRVAGVKAAVQAFPKWLEGDGRDLGDIYAKGRDEARRTVDDAVKAYPVAPLVGSLAMAPFTPIGATSAARIGGGVVTGGLGGFGASRSGDTLGDTLKGAGLGGALSGTLEGAGRGVRWLAGRAGQQGDLAEDVIRQKALETTKSAAGAVSQEASAKSAELGRQYELAKSVLERVSATPEERAVARATMELPEVQAWLVNRQQNAVAGLGSGSRRFAELSQAASEAQSEVPAAAKALAASKIENAGQPLLDSAKRLALRGAVGGAGSLIGRGIGAATDAMGITEEGKTKGTYIGALTGFTPSGVVNMARTHWSNPQTQLIANRSIQSLLPKTADISSGAAQLATQIGSQSMAQTGRPQVPTQLTDLLSRSRGPQSVAPMSELSSPRDGRAPQQPQQTTQSQATSGTSEPDAGVQAFLDGWN